MYWRSLYVPLPASEVGNATIHLFILFIIYLFIYKLNNIYSRNLTATSNSFQLAYTTLLLTENIFQLHFY